MLSQNYKYTVKLFWTFVLMKKNYTNYFCFYDILFASSPNFATLHVYKV